MPALAQIIPAVILTSSLVAVSVARAQSVETTAARDRAALVTRIDSIVTSNLKVAGMSVAAVRGRDTIVMKGYGFADIENDVPATPQTVYRIGSITKQFTSAAVIQLVDQGRISLDDAITKYLPHAPVHGRHVTVRQLLNHTSGIPSYTDVRFFARIMRQDLPHDSLVATIAHDSLLFEPGTHFYYNNTGYFLLGMLIEKVTGKSYPDALAAQLFAPLGLNATTYCSTAPIIKHRAQGYSLADGKPRNADYISMDLPFAAGSLCSTVGDLVKWTTALSTGRVVSNPSYRQMITPLALSSGRKNDYGFGLFAGKLGEHPMISHGGGINGFISHLAYFPDDSLTVVVLANSIAPSNAIALNIVRAILGMPLQTGPEAPKDLATTPDLRAKLVGTYLLTQPDGSRVPAHISERGKALELQIKGQRPRKLLYQGEATFAVDNGGDGGGGGSRVNFDIPDGARATGFQLEAGGRPLEAVRH